MTKTISLDLTFEHAFRDAMRVQRQRLVDACGSDYAPRIHMHYSSEKLYWVASLGGNYNDQLEMKGEVLEELVDLIIDTYHRKNNLTLRALPAPDAIEPVALPSSEGGDF